MIKTYWFVDNVTGEEFFVEEENAKKARYIARLYFEEPVLYGTVDEETAEWYGFDTY